MTRETDRRARDTARAKGQEIIDGLRELAEALEAGEPLGRRFTVRTYRIAPPPEYRGADVRRVRGLMSLSQAAFAAFLGVDRSTVRSWEQGLRPPSPVSCRLMSEIESDPPHWRRRLADCLAGAEPEEVPAVDEDKPKQRRTKAAGEVG
ncbi:helix-turn-helix domain-containing protein [Tautonia plasticadhaerens]|uniref:Helix-turn-helix protein n=1 Tax=Tautonia plasticadhaerens TaxID=2527974 RepID=A0A518HFF0_9BACT|nr:helix-turn-helix domain-containing protein [Tautonia plasticadhaerens]QDV39565.1 helix-turn-helix protein [Tautonia plasticadhaerens]